jgi:fructose/tagatose bisphosphate aldolase
LPLFSSHGLDLTKENEEEEIVTKCEEYFQRMASMKIWLEIKLKIDQGVAVEGNFTNESHEKVSNFYRVFNPNWCLETFHNPGNS